MSEIGEVLAMVHAEEQLDTVCTKLTQILLISLRSWPKYHIIILTEGGGQTSKLSDLLLTQETCSDRPQYIIH